MKKVFFFANIFPDDKSRGITKKVFSQISALNNLNYEVSYYTGYTPDGAAVFNKENKIVFQKRYKFKNKNLRRILRNQLLKDTAYEFLKKSDIEIDLAYLRYVYFDNKTLKILKLLKQKKKFVLMEAHAYPIYQKKVSPMLLVYLVDFLFIPKIKKNIDLVVAISNQKNIWGVKTINIDNGVNIKEYAPRKEICMEDKTINIISVAYEWEAHGYSRILHGLYNYYNSGGMRTVNIYFVGTLMKKTEQLIKKLHLEDHVFFVGKKTGKDLDKIYDICHLGMGVLAPYVFGSDIGTGLKIKEYMAKGIPYFYAGKTLNENEKFPYRISVPLDNSDIVISDLIEFYDKIKNPKMISEIRNYAKKYSWENIYQQVLKEVSKYNENFDNQ